MNAPFVLLAVSRLLPNEMIRPPFGNSPVVLAVISVFET